MPFDFIVLKDGPLVPRLVQETASTASLQAYVEVLIPENVVIPHHDSHGNPKKIGPAILAYMVDPSDDAKDLIYEINLHHMWFSQMHGADVEDLWTPLTSPRLTGGVRRGYWEVISSQLLRPSVAPFNVPGYPTLHPANEGTYIQSIHFKVVSGHGTVTFSDIVLLFRW